MNLPGFSSIYKSSRSLETWGIYCSGLCWHYFFIAIAMEKLPAEIWSKIDEELAILDREPVLVEGLMLKPSQCYYVGKNPRHILFNTNCPGALRQKIEAIIARHSKKI